MSLFKDSINNSLKTDNVKKKDIKEDSIEKNINNDEVFVLKKRPRLKENKKVFNVYLAEEKLKRLDKLCKKSNYKRNDLVTKMIDYCLDNWKVEE